MVSSLFENFFSSWYHLYDADAGELTRLSGIEKEEEREPTLVTTETKEHFLTIPTAIQSSHLEESS
jgi:hypothetical protein